MMGGILKEDWSEIFHHVSVNWITLSSGFGVPCSSVYSDVLERLVKAYFEIKVW